MADTPASDLRVRFQLPDGSIIADNVATPTNALCVDPGSRHHIAGRDYVVRRPLPAESGSGVDLVLEIEPVSA